VGTNRRQTGDVIVYWNVSELVIKYSNKTYFCCVQETAINVGYSSQLFDEVMDIIIINATSEVTQ